MPATDISQYMHAALSPDGPIGAELLKSFPSGGGVTAGDFFAPPMGGFLNSSTEDLEQVRGWNWTAILIKALQFTQADVAVYCSKELADLHSEAFGEYEDEHVSSVSGMERRNVPKGYVVAPTTHTVARLMDQPNPWMDGTQLKFELSQQLEVHGVALILVIPDEHGKPEQIYILPRSLCYPQPACPQFPEGSWVTGRLCRYFNATTIDKDPETLAEMYARLSNRQFRARYVIPIGLPSLIWRDDFANPTRAIADVLDTDKQLHTSRRQTFQNASGGGPRFKADAGVSLTRDQQEQIVAEYQAELAGSANAGRSGFVPPGVTLDEKPTARDMDYTEGAKETRDSTLAQRGVPPAMAGIGEMSSYASVLATIRGQSVITGQPMMRIVAGQLEVGLKRFFRPPYNQFVVRIQANTLNDPAQKLQELQLEISAGTVEKGEVREAMGRKPWGDARDQEIAGVPSAPGPPTGMPAQGQDPIDALAAGPPTAKVQMQAVGGDPARMAQLAAGPKLTGPEKPVPKSLPGQQDRPGQESPTAQMPENTRFKAINAPEPPCQYSCGKTKQTGGEDMLLKSSGGQYESDLLYFRAPLSVMPRVREWQRVVANSFPVKTTVDMIHVSVAYPVLDVGRNAPLIAAAVGDQPQFSVVLGRVKVFRNADADVIVIAVESNDLGEVRNSLLTRIRVGISGHLNYQPHLTLAYCRPGSVPRAMDDTELDGLSGVEFDVTELMLTDSGTEHVLSLGTGRAIPFWSPGAGAVLKAAGTETRDAHGRWSTTEGRTNTKRQGFKSRLSRQSRDRMTVEGDDAMEGTSHLRNVVREHAAAHGMATTAEGQTETHVDQQGGRIVTSKRGNKHVAQFTPAPQVTTGPVDHFQLFTTPRRFKSLSLLGERDSNGNIVKDMEPARQAFGLTGTDEEVAHQLGHIAGASNGSDVVVTAKENGYYKVRYTNAHEGVAANRSINTVTRKIYNDSFFLADNKQGRGTGTKMLATEIAMADKHGITRVHTYACRSDGSMNGYYSWPALGYDAPISSLYLSQTRKEEVTQLFPQATKVQDLMATSEGAAWWKEHGQSFDAEFEMAPGSRSRRVLAKAVQKQLDRHGPAWLEENFVPQATSRPANSATVTRGFGTDMDIDHSADLLKAAGDGGHWVTMRGTPVYIDGEGNATKGPAWVNSKKQRFHASRPKSSANRMNPTSAIEMQGTSHLRNAVREHAAAHGMTTTTQGTTETHTSPDGSQIVVTKRDNKYHATFHVGAEPSTQQAAEPNATPKNGLEPFLEKQEYSRLIIAHDAKARIRQLRSVYNLSEDETEAAHQLAQMAGAHSGSTVTISNSWNGGVSVNWSNTADYCSASRTIDPHGHQHNDSFFIRAEGQGNGTGTRMVARVVANGLERGLKKLDTQACRSSTMNGYYTWATLGFDAPLQGIRTKDPAGLRTNFPDAKRVSDLMLTTGGQQWWKEHGTTFEAEFDLKEGSISRKILEKKVKRDNERQQATRTRDAAFNAATAAARAVSATITRDSSGSGGTRHDSGRVGGRRGRLPGSWTGDSGREGSQVLNDQQDATDASPQTSKAAGLTTTSGEAGGFAVTQNRYAREDDQWMAKSMELANVFDELYGDM